MAKESKKRNLGRGLSALLGEDAAPEAIAEGPNEIRRLPVEFLTPGRFQPRQTVDDEPLRELAQSIADKGVLQPLLVRADETTPDRYEIIAGERRWRAAQLAQVHEVPVIIKELGDSEALEIALIENLQREDLSALDEAQGYQRLKDEFAYTQAELAASLGKSRSHVANTLRLLNLPDPVKGMIAQGALTAGHARALLNADDPAALARAVARRGLNVRQTEKLVQKEQRPARVKAEPTKDADTVALENELANILGLKVGIAFRGDQGSMTIHYQSLEQLDDILFRLSQGALGAFNMPLEGADGGSAWVEPTEPDYADDELPEAMPDDEADNAALAAADEALSSYSEDGASLSFADTSAAIADILAEKAKAAPVSPGNHEEDYAATAIAIDEILANADAYDADAIDEITAEAGNLGDLTSIDPEFTSEPDADSSASVKDINDADDAAEDTAGVSPDANEIDAMLAAADIPDNDEFEADVETGTEADESEEDLAEASPDADAIDAMLAAAEIPDVDDMDGAEQPDAELSDADAAALIAGIAEGLGLNDIPTNGAHTGDLSADNFLIDDDDDDDATADETEGENPRDPHTPE